MIKELPSLDNRGLALKELIQYAGGQSDPWFIVFWNPWVQPSFIYKTLGVLGGLGNLDKNNEIEARRVHVSEDESYRVLFVRYDKTRKKKEVRRVCSLLENYFGRLDEELVCITVIESWMEWDNTWRHPFNTSTINWTLFKLLSGIRTAKKINGRNRIIVR